MLVALCAVPLLLAAKAPPAQPVAYQVSPAFDAAGLAALKVEIRFRANARGVTTLDLPDHWAGRTETWRNLRDLQVDGARSVSSPDPSHRLVRSAPGAPLVVRYRVVSGIDHEPLQEDQEPFVPWIRPDWFYAFGQAVFVTPEGLEDAPARFDWTGAPPGFAFVSDLEHLQGATRPASRPGTVKDVVVSVMMGGRDIELISRTDHGAPMRIAIRKGDYGFSSAAFADQVLTVIAEQRRFFGGRAEPFLVTIAPVQTHPGGVSIGGTSAEDAYGMAVSPSAPPNELKAALSHESFHSWNPYKLGGYPPEYEGQLAAWFGEGFTDFFGRRLALRAGVVDPQAFAAVWNRQLLAYATSPARLAPNSRLADGFWADRDLRDLPYQRGAILAALWNARLRQASSGRLSLDDVIRAQRDAAAKPGAASADRLFVATARGFGLDLADDVARYVERGEAITLPADAFGPCGAVVTETRPVYDPGFDLAATMKAARIVTGVEPGSTAFAAGLRNGMTLVRRTAGAPRDSTVLTVYEVTDAGRPREIRYLPQGRGETTVQQLRLPTPLPADCAAELSR